MIRHVTLVAIAMAALVSSAEGQGTAAARVGPSTALRGASSGAIVAQSPSSGSLPLEMLAGSAAAGVAYAVAVYSVDCGVDDLACGILRAGGAGLLGAVFSATAVNMVARRTGAPHSWWGAGLGSLIGLPVGLGVHYLINRNSDRNLDDAIVIPIFAISQGVFATLGSRAAATR